MSISLATRWLALLYKSIFFSFNAVSHLSIIPGLMIIEYIFQELNQITIQKWDH